MGNVCLIAVIALGMMALRVPRWSEEYALMLFFAVIASFIAISDGYYWSILPRADPYDSDYVPVFGLTPNQWISIIIFAMAFFGPSVAQKRGWLAFPNWFGQPAAREIKARFEVFRASRFIDVHITNGGKTSVYLQILAFQGPSGNDEIELASASSGQATGNLLDLKTFRLPSGATTKIEVESDHWGEVTGAWLHGRSSGSWIPWHLPVVMTESPK